MSTAERTFAAMLKGSLKAHREVAKSGRDTGLGRAEVEGEPDDPNLTLTPPFSLQQVMVHVPNTPVQAVMSKCE